jgi:signal transduction histidine kinase
VTKRLLLGYLGLTLIVLLALEVPLGIQNARTERHDLESKVEHDATSIASLAQTAVHTRSQRQLAGVAAIASSYAHETGGRVVVVGARGQALVDTTPLGSGRETFASRPEIGAALQGRVAEGTRWSRTLHERLLYVAVPVATGGRVEGAARITYPMSSVDARIVRYWLILLAIGAAVLALAAVVGLRVGAFVTRPLRRLEATAAAVGRGDLAARAPDGEGPPEVRSLARVFNATVAQLEQLLRSQREFVADASHQLRTPLTALRLRLENLQRDDDRPELDAALAEVERLGTLVEDLLRLARADAQVESAPGEVDLCEVARNRVETWSALAEEHGLTLVLATEGRGLARASAARIGQVLDNLIENAIHVSPEKRTVQVTAGDCELRVADEGPGLDADARERAFDRFWRAGDGEGSGLGLAIVKRLVEADGGEIALEPRAGGGLEAVVRYGAVALRPAPRRRREAAGVDWRS